MLIMDDNKFATFAEGHGSPNERRAWRQLFLTRCELMDSLLAVLDDHEDYLEEQEMMSYKADFYYSQSQSLNNNVLGISPCMFAAQNANHRIEGIIKRKSDDKSLYERLDIMLNELDMI